MRGRFRRTPLLLSVLGVGLAGGIVIFALEARPDADGTVVVGLEQAYAGTAYAFDGTLCLGSPQVAAEVVSIEVEQAPGGRTELLRPPEGGRPSIGFPVDADDAGGDVEGYRVPAGEDDCTLRVLVTPSEQGAVQAGTIRVRMAYGPFGLLRRTATVRPQVSLDVTGTGEDPRSDLG